MQNSAYKNLLNLNFSATRFVYIFVKGLTEAAKLLKVLQKMRFEG